MTVTMGRAKQVVSAGCTLTRGCDVAVAVVKPWTNIAGYDGNAPVRTRERDICWRQKKKVSRRLGGTSQPA